MEKKRLSHHLVKAFRTAGISALHHILVLYLKSSVRIKPLWLNKPDKYTAVHKGLDSINKCNQLLKHYLYSIQFV